MSPGQRTRVVALLASLITGLTGGSPAAAQGVRAWLGPLNSFSQGAFGTGNRYEYCPGNNTIEWELTIENDTDAEETVDWDVWVRSGRGGNNLKLECPAVLLPPGVDPVADVTCDTSINNHLWVRNIVLPPCERTYLRFNTSGDPGLPGFEDICVGGYVGWSRGWVHSQTALPDQVPVDRGNTCLYMQSMCGPGTTNDLKLWYTMADENGPPLRPGDTVLFRCDADFRFLGVPPPNEVYLQVWDAATDSTDTATALPPHIDFVEFVSKPLEAKGARYEYLAASRQLRIIDPGCPGTACQVALPLQTGALTEFVQWRGRVNCLAPNLGSQCAYSRAYIYSSWGSSMPLGQDDVHSYADGGDKTCATPTLPDLSRSAKRVEDGDASGDAQPGELLTFSIDVTNSTVCPDAKMTCECRATGVVVRDTVDLSQLEPGSLVALDGGVLTPPNQIQWTIRAVEPDGLAGSTRSVRFQARVKTTAQSGDTICNSATIQAAELTSSADGGLSSCPTAPITAVALSPCLVIASTGGPSVFVTKAVSPTPSCYAPGSRITYTVTATNAGSAPATALVLRDLLDPAWCPAPGGCQVSNISNGGTLSGSTVTWPPLASLPGGGGTRSETFDLVIPADTADATVLPNEAEATFSPAPLPIRSNSVLVPVCAPAIEFEKTASATRYEEGELLTWTLTVANTGGATATSVVISDIIDVTRIDEATLSFNPATGTWDSTAKRYTWPVVPSLAGGGTPVLSYAISGRILPGTAGSRICNTGRVEWDQGAAPLASTPTAGTCSDIGAPSCTPAALGSIGPVKAVRRGLDAEFSWPGLAAAPPEYHLNAVGAKSDIPPASSCPAVTGSRRAGCGAGVPLDTRTTPDASHVGAVSDPSRLLFYQVYAACGGSGDLEGPG